MKTWLMRCLMALCFSCAAGTAAELDDPSERMVQTERYHVEYVINANGSFVENRHWAIKVLKKQVLEHVKEASVSYSTSIQKAEVLEAYTLKPDGRRIDVPKSNYQVQVNGGQEGSGPVFSDVTTTSVVFPELEVGDTVVFAYRLTASKPMFDNHFSVVENFPRSSYFGDVKVRIDAPESLWTQHQAWQLKEVRNETAGGRKVVEWSYQNKAPVKGTGQGSTYDMERHPGLVYSTFRGYADITEAYGSRARPKAAVTARIQKLADEVAGPRKEPRDIAQALYEWVSTNITYAGNCIGLGAVVPHDIDFILDNKMGDCKDHATLLQALLSAKGVESSQALINAGNVYRLPKVPVVSIVNHVLNYIPALDLYVDATSKGIPFGMLPYEDIGKPILLVDGYRDGTRTPTLPVDRNRQRMLTTLKIDADGSIKGKVDVTLAGMYAVAAKSRFRDMSKQQIQEQVTAYFKGVGNEGLGSLVQDDPRPMLDAHKYSVDFEAKQALPMPGAFAILPLFYNEAPVAGFAAAATDEVADDDTACISGHSEEAYVYEFPEQVKVIAVPANLSLSSGVLSYEATYELKGNVLTAKRVFDDRTPGATCTPQFNQAYKDFVLKVLPNLRSQVVYQ